jgi:hypothetical protein
VTMYSSASPGSRPRPSGGRSEGLRDRAQHEQRVLIDGQRISALVTPWHP